MVNRQNPSFNSSSLYSIYFILNLIFILTVVIPHISRPITAAHFQADHCSTFPRQSLQHISTPITAAHFHADHCSTFPGRSLQHISTPITAAHFHANHCSTFPRQSLQHISTPITAAHFHADHCSTFPGRSLQHISTPITAAHFHADHCSNRHIHMEARTGCNVPNDAVLKPFDEPSLGQSRDPVYMPVDVFNQNQNHFISLLSLVTLRIGLINQIDHHFYSHNIVFKYKALTYVIKIITAKPIVTILNIMILLLCFEALGKMECNRLPIQYDICPRVFT